MRLATTTIAASVVLLAACGGGGNGGSPASQPATSSPTAATPTVAAPTLSPAPTLATAIDVLNAIEQAGLPIAEVDDYTAATDPNELLGRPHGYTSKVNFHDSRLELTKYQGAIDTSSGGSVEFFPNASDAADRFSYLGVVARGVLTEYDYLSGTVVLRLSKSFTPDQAAAYDSALKAIIQ